jgi:hypothetical protein
MVDQAKEKGNAALVYTARIVVIAMLVFFCVQFVGSYFQATEQKRLEREAAAIRRVAKLHSQLDPASGKTFIDATDGFVRYDDAQLAMCRLTNSPFVWKCSLRIPLDASVEEELMFYACSSSATSDGRRCFIFPAPVYLKILKDSEVDWRSQRIKKIPEE